MHIFIAGICGTFMAGIALLAREKGIKTVSVTGGEPLIHASFLAGLLPRFKKEGLSVYLETAGVHPELLKGVVSWCDVIAMDVKLPSATGREFWKEHKEFLNVGRGKIFIKIVIERHTLRREFEKAVQLAAEAEPPPLLVLQPVTPEQDGIEPPAEDQLESFRKFAASRLPKVLILPQKHKEWRIR